MQTLSFYKKGYKEKDYRRFLLIERIEWVECVGDDGGGTYRFPKMILPWTSYIISEEQLKK